MTGTTTQLMLDLADMTRGIGNRRPGATLPRLRRLTTSVVVFAAGCALAALLYARVTEWCFCLLPVLGIATLMMREEIAAADSPR